MSPWPSQPAFLSLESPAGVSIWLAARQSASGRAHSAKLRAPFLARRCQLVGARIVALITPRAVLDRWCRQEQPLAAKYFSNRPCIQMSCVKLVKTATSKFTPAPGPVEACLRPRHPVRGSAPRPSPSAQTNPSTQRVWIDGLTSPAMLLDRPAITVLRPRRSSQRL